MPKGSLVLSTQREFLCCPSGHRPKLWNYLRAIPLSIKTTHPAALAYFVVCICGVFNARLLPRSLRNYQASRKCWGVVNVRAGSVRVSTCFTQPGSTLSVPGNYRNRPRPFVPPSFLLLRSCEMQCGREATSIPFIPQLLHTGLAKLWFFWGGFQHMRNFKNFCRGNLVCKVVLFLQRSVRRIVRPSIMCSALNGPTNRRQQAAWIHVGWLRDVSIVRRMPIQREGGRRGERFAVCLGDCWIPPALGKREEFDSGSLVYPMSCSWHDIRFTEDGA